MRKEEAEKKAQEAEEKRKKLEEAEKKRQEMMKAQKEKQNAAGPGKGGSKKSGDSVKAATASLSLAYVYRVADGERAGREAGDDQDQGAARGGEENFP